MNDKSNIRFYCWTCGKSVTSELPSDAILRAVAICPECIEAKKIIFPDDEKADKCLNGTGG